MEEDKFIPGLEGLAWLKPQVGKCKVYLDDCVYRLFRLEKRAHSCYKMAPSQREENNEDCFCHCCDLGFSGTSVKWGQTVLTFSCRQAGILNHQWLRSGVLHYLRHDIISTSYFVHAVGFLLHWNDSLSVSSITRGMMVVFLCCQKLGLNFFQRLLL